MKNKYLKGAIGKKALMFFLILFALFCVVAVGGGLVRVVFDDDTLTMATLVKRIVNRESIIQKSKTEKKLLAVSNEKSSVELTAHDDSLKLSLASIEKDRWPENATGGLYELNPSGEFKQGATFKMILAETPPADFALGYWHPDTKKWEWLPTAKRDEKTFETILVHASEIGGASGGACSSMPKDSENIQMYNEIKAEMGKIQIDQQTGEAAALNDASWKPVWDRAKEMTDKAINDYCKKQNLTAEYDFYAAWELVQCLGFPSLDERFASAWDNQCEDPEKIRQFKIDQTDDFSSTLNLDLGWFYQQNSTFKGTIYYSGYPRSIADKGKPSWKTDWKVRSFVDSAGNLNQTGHLETKDGYYDLKALNTSSQGTDSYEWTFSLANVSEGESFPVKMVRSGTYTSRMSGPNATIVMRGGGTNVNASASMQGYYEIGPGHTMTFDGVLFKDMGDDGAIITFSGDVKLTSEQKKQFEEVMKMQKESGLPDMWSAPGKSNLVKTEGASSPLRIVPVGEMSEPRSGDDDWKANEEDLSNSPSRQGETRPNDKNGDGIPDLAPMPTPGDANADGFPD